MEGVSAVGSAEGWQRARPLLVAALAAGLLSVAIPFLPVPERASNALGNGLQLAAAAFAAWLCVAASRRHEGRARTGWLLLGLGAGAWALGQVAWSWYEVVLGTEVPTPGVNDLGYLALYPLALLGMLFLSPLTKRHGVVRASLLLEGLLSALAIFVVAWPLVLQSSFERIDDPRAALVAVAYPLGDIVLLSVVGGVLMRQWAVWRSGLGLAYAAFVCLLVADLGWTTGIFQDSYVTGQAADAGWIVGFMLLAAATRAPLPTKVPSGPYALAVGRFLPLAAVVLGMAGLIIGSLRGLTAGLGVRLSMGALVLFALWRQMLFMKEFAALAAEREAAQGRYDLIVQDALEGIFRTTEDGRILMANPEYARIAGYASVEDLRANVANVKQLYVDPNDRAPLVAALKADGQVTAYEVRIRRRDGQVRWISLNMRAKPGADGLEFDGFSRDITETHQLAYDLNRTQRTLLVISHFNQALVGAEDESALLQGVCDSLTKQGGYLLAWIGLAQDDPERSVKPVAQSGFEEGYVGKVRATWAPKDPRGIGPTGRAIREGRTQIAQDILHDPSMAPWRQDATPRGYAASCALPLDLKQYGRGALMVYAAEPAAFGPDEVKLLEELAKDLAYGVVSLRDRQAKKEADARREAVQTDYRALFENMTEGFAHCRMLFEAGVPVDWEYLRVNRNFGPLTGLAEVAGKRVSQVIPGLRETNPGLFEAYARVARGGPPERFESEVPTLKRWFSVSVYHAAPDEFIAVFDDITQRKHAEHRLRQSEQMLEEAQRLAKVGGWRYDPRTQRVTATSEVVRIYEGEPQVLEGAEPSLFISHFVEGDRQRMAAAFKAAVERGTPYDLELELVTVKGNHRIVRTIGQAEMQGGIVTHVFGNLIDITDQRKAEQVREKLARQEAEVRRLEELNQMRMEFLNAAAHDLKTPLTPLKLQMATLRLKGGLDAAQKSSLDLMDRNLARFQVLVDDMLDAARLQAGHLKLRREDVLLGPLVLEAATSFQEPAKQGGLTLTVAPLPEVRVDADPGKLMQVLMNVVSNAVKYTPLGGTVRIQVEVNAKEAVVKVQDSGLGMTPEQLGKLFQAFVRLHEATPGVAKGTGLGLYISKGIVEQHGGRIWAESQGPGKGSTFFVAWPLAGKGPATKPMAAA